MAGLTAAEKAAQRIPFGKNGIKDGNGNVIRSDHPTLSQVVMDIVDGTGVTRQDILDARIAEAVEGMKAGQDRSAKIKRNTY